MDNRRSRKATSYRKVKKFTITIRNTKIKVELLLLIFTRIVPYIIRRSDERRTKEDGHALTSPPRYARLRLN